MIQRIQTVWLLFATICAFLTIKVHFFTLAGVNPIGTTKVENNGLSYFTAQSNVFIFILTVAIALASIVTIFLYKDRKKQVFITSCIALGAIINIILYFAQIKTFISGQYELALTSIITFLIPLFLLLAVRGIWKDEKLVKSADRLR